MSGNRYDSDHPVRLTALVSHVTDMVSLKVVKNAFKVTLFVEQKIVWGSYWFEDERNHSDPGMTSVGTKFDNHDKVRANWYFRSKLVIRSVMDSL